MTEIEEEFYKEIEKKCEEIQNELDRLKEVLKDEKGRL